VDDWLEVPLSHDGSVGRGIGVADLAQSLVSGRPHRVSGALACHVLDVMQSFEESSASGRHVEMSTSCERPAALPMGLPPGFLDK
jgi:hypothetical protein